MDAALAKKMVVAKAKERINYSVTGLKDGAIDLPSVT